jgi:hypothetical protein
MPVSFILMKNYCNIICNMEAIPIKSETTIYNIMKLYFVLPFFIAFFIPACSPLGGQARGKPRYPT